MDIDYYVTASVHSTKTDTGKLSDQIDIDFYNTVVSSGVQYTYWKWGTKFCQIHHVVIFDKQDSFNNKFGYLKHMKTRCSSIVICLRCFYM